MTAAPLAHDLTTALQRAFAGMKVLDPRTGQPFTEAMLLGMGGGLGMGYILFEFKQHGSANIVMGFRHRWNYAAESALRICERLNAPTQALESGGDKAALAHLESALQAGAPVPVWADKANLSYQQLPERLKGYGIHVISVHELRADSALVGDLSEQLWEISRAELAAARAQVPSDKRRVLKITRPESIDLSASVRAGIADCIDHLSAPSESFSLPVLLKWAKMFTDKKNKKGWHTAFASRVGLFDALTSIYESITLDNTDGAGLRTLYADFLEAVTDLVPTAEAAAAYRHTAEAWKTFAAAALPESIPPLAQARQLMDQRYAAFRQNNSAEHKRALSEYYTLRDAANASFPADDTAVNALFEHLQDQLMQVHAAEITALDALRRTAR